MMRTMPLAISRELRMRFSGFEWAEFAVRHGRTPCRFWKRHVANARVLRERTSLSCRLEPWLEGPDPEINRFGDA